MIHTHDTATFSARTDNIKSVTGVLLITLCALLYDARPPFPGTGALPVILGTLLILDAQTTVLNRRLLSWKPLRFIGLISYSLYLWHWPVISIYHYIFEAEPRTGIRILLTVVSMVLATVSYYVIERPFRAAQLPWHQVFLRYGSVMALLTVIFAITWQQRGFPSRWPIAFVQMLAEAEGAEDICMTS
ncbi:acyltransferase family protein [Trabulsiella odontotermitis]|uniref:acyltransferase family protein n=1 Tax=Trabulsiella odontotermitis TaxID=379893 RepID=UPI0006BA1123|nr:acyltransferase [Trabulsiella odontotermitis]